MKKSITKLLLALLISSIAMAQKEELKIADRLLKKGNISGAKLILEVARTGIMNADDRYKAQYYFLNGKMHFEMVKKEPNSFEYASEVIKSFDSLLGMKESFERNKYFTDIQQIRDHLADTIEQRAQKSYESKDFKAAARGFEVRYRLILKDTSLLHRAADIAYQGKAYDIALNYYEELKDINYTDIKITYIATNIKTGEEQQMSSRRERDLMIVAGTHTDPKTKETTSKRCDILKKIAVIYIEQGKNDTALEAITNVRAECTTDGSIILKEAEIYLKHLDDKDTYKTLIIEAAEKEAENPDILYKIAVLEIDQKRYKEARKYLEEALEIDPKFIEASLELSDIYKNEVNDIIETMNKLALRGRSSSAEYHNLRKEKNNLLRTWAQTMEETLKGNPGNKLVLEQLKKSYAALNDRKNMKRVDEMLKEVK